MTHRVSMSPAQRFILWAASHDPGLSIPPNFQESYKKFMGELYLRGPARQIRVFQGGICSNLVRSNHTSFEFNVSKETADFIVHILSNTVFTGIGLDILDEIPDVARRIAKGDFPLSNESMVKFDEIEDIKLWTIPEDELPPIPLK